jgi:UDP-glucose 4-epimerase
VSILVTGGCGYIGSHFLNLLAESPEYKESEIIVLDNLSSGSKANLLHNEKLIQIDLCSEEALRTVFKESKIETVIHFAASTDVLESVQNPLKYFSNNSQNTLCLLKLCQEFKVKKFIFSSTAAVYGFHEAYSLEGIAREDSPTNPVNPYGWSKLLCEQMVRGASQSSEMKHIILRYFNVAGAEPTGKLGQRNASSQLIKVCCEASLGLRPEVQIFGTDYATPDGTGIRDYIHVQDLAEAHICALKTLDDSVPNNNQNKTFNIGYGRGFSVREVIETTKKISGINFVVKEHARRPGDLGKMIAHAREIKSLGWKPWFDSLETIVSHSLAWEKKLLQEKTNLAGI